MKIFSVGAELFHADGQTDRHDEANSLFPVLRKHLKMTRPPPSPLTLAFFQISVIFLVRTVLSVRSNLRIPRNNKSNVVTAFCPVFLSVFSCYQQFAKNTFD